MRRSLALALLLGAAACHGSGRAGGDGGTFAQFTEACQDYANAICALYESCNGYYVARTYGDAPTCVARQLAACQTRLAVPGTGNSSESTEACAAALPGESCSQLFGSNPSGPCIVIAGPSKDGAACAVAAQCQSQSCVTATNAICGTCGPPPTRCSTDGDYCPQGTVCLAATDTCGTPGGVGASCVDQQPDCQFGLACERADAGPGLCTAASPPEGSCDLTKTVGPGCAYGSYCAKVAGSGTCVQEGVAPIGQTCGRVNDVETTCAALGSCRKALPDAGTGTCVAAAADGAACNVDAGPGCLALARCVVSGPGGIDGTCEVAGSQSCH